MRVTELKASGYNPRDYYESNADLRAVIDLIGSGIFSSGDTELFKPPHRQLAQPRSLYGTR